MTVHRSSPTPTVVFATSEVLQTDKIKIKVLIDILFLNLTPRFGLLMLSYPYVYVFKSDPLFLNNPAVVA